VKAALASIEIDEPKGISSSIQRQALAPPFVTKFVDDGKGALFSRS